MKLNFGSYANIIYEYMDLLLKDGKRITKYEFVKLLLIAGYDESEKNVVENRHRTTRTKFFTCSRSIDDGIQVDYRREKTGRNVMTHFEKEIIPKLDEYRLDEMLAKLCTLIQSDDSIPAEQKDFFLNLINENETDEDKNKQDTIAFLSETFIYAIQQENDKSKYEIRVEQNKVDDVSAVEALPADQQNETPIYMIIGENQDENDDLPDPIDEYKQNLLKKRQSATHRDNGARLGNSGKWLEAIGEYEKAIELNPDDVHCRVGLAWAYWGFGGLEVAVALYDIAHEWDPDNTKILNSRENCSNQLHRRTHKYTDNAGQLKEAESTAETILYYKQKYCKKTVGESIVKAIPTGENNKKSDTNAITKSGKPHVNFNPSDASADFKVAIEYYEQSDFEQAINYFDKAIESGDSYAMGFLGYMYSEGNHVEWNKLKAIELWTKAISIFNETGKYSNRHPNDIRTWMEIYIAHSYFDGGGGVIQNYQLAYEYYLSAAKAENPIAYKRLGDIYRDGLGLARPDRKLARKWYIKAAVAEDDDRLKESKQCHEAIREAQYQLGSLYKKKYSIFKKKNNAKALNWFTRAATNGHRKAKEELEQF